MSGEVLPCEGLSQAVGPRVSAGPAGPDSDPSEVIPRREAISKNEAASLCRASECAPMLLLRFVGYVHA